MLTIFSLPFLILMGIGGFWLWEHNWLYQAIGVLSANSVFIYTLLHQRSKKIKSKKLFNNPIIIIIAQRIKKF